jgi:hypothetical protein
LPESGPCRSDQRNQCPRPQSHFGFSSLRLRSCLVRRATLLRASKRHHWPRSA